jgi:hypothetical protein
MNIVVIILGITVIILIYYLYVTFISNRSSLITKIDLNKETKTIAETDIPNSGSSRYAYSTWVYVNTWNNNSIKSIVSRGTRTVNGKSVNDFKLYLDSSTPSLKIDIYGRDPVKNLDVPQTIIATNNFPIQRWTYVNVSVDGSIVDVYLDGKLVYSKQLQFIPFTPSGSIIIGGENQDIQLARLNRQASPMDPQTAWNTYLQGNGISGTSSYNVKLAVLQNDVEQKKFTLF